MRKIILALMAIIILLVGCEGGDTAGPTSKAFIGGTDSIEFNFMEETPPREVYDSGEQPFEVTLNLENKGEYDVALGDITVKLTGFYPGDFSSPVVEKNPEEDLSKSYVDPDGEVERGTITYVNFEGFNFAGSLVGNNEYTIRADVCYKYGTKAQADLCVLDDLTPLDPQGEVCMVNEGKPVASSSAPVQVENFKEEVAGTRKVKFTFDIVHRKSGLVSKLDSSCNNDLTIKNKVWVEVETGDLSTGLSCSGLNEGTSTTGYVTIFGGKRKVTCMQDISDLSGDFEKKVNIELKYDYKENKEQDILVKHITG
jgi:hypothetical protein